jgi:hypothetical protein
MIPAIKDVVKDVDLEGRKMTIHLIDGIMWKDNCEICSTYTISRNVRIS